MTRTIATSLSDDGSVTWEALRAELLRVIDERDAALAAKEHAERTLKLHMAKRFGPRAETLDAAQLALFADEVKAIKVKAEAESVTVAGHTRKKYGPKPLPASLPRETKINALSAEERACPCCSKERVEVDRTVHEVLEVQPATLRIIVHVTPIYACVECRGQETRAPAPTLPLPKSYAGASLLAHVAVSKFADRLCTVSSVNSRVEKLTTPVEVDHVRLDARLCRAAHAADGVDEA